MPISSKSCLFEGIALSIRGLLCNQMLLSHGGRVCIERCKNQVLELPQYKGALSINGPYAVAYHQSDRVIIITSSTESSAQAICDVISDEWARVLMDVQRSEVRP